MANVLFTNARVFDATGAQPYAGEVLVQGSAEFLANDPKAREIYLGPEFNM